MKYSFDVHEFSFNKIKNGTRKVGVHLFDENAQQIKLHDILDMHNISNDEHLECTIKGIALFDNFNDLIDCIGAAPLGYDNKEELMLRLERMYPQTEQNKYSAVAFFLELLQEKVRLVVRDEIER